MNTQNISTLKIHKLSKEQYDRELQAGRIDSNALYLTPEELTGEENQIIILDNKGTMQASDVLVTDLAKKADLATVATSGSYNDLTNKPTIPSAYTHPSHTAKTSGLYKITVNNLGHVSAATAVTKSDITGLGIPAQDTTYSAGTGISLSGTTFSNSGVRSISTGSTNGTISVNTNGTSTDIAVKGLGSNAYNSTTYAGGTKVTLNGSSKGGSTASFYAPTTAGTKDYILVSNGSGAPVWADASTLNTGSTPQKITLVATAGQTAFTIPFEYDSLSSNLTVYFNGILMKETDNYTVNTTNNTVNLAGFSAEAGDIVTIMGLLGAQSIDFGQEAINAINDINAAVAAAKEELQDAVDQASTDINNLIKQLPSNWNDYLNKNANNVMNSGSKITMASNYTPSGNYDVTTKTYVDSAISTATSNIVTDVFYMGDTEDNTKKKLLWIDTSSENGNGVIKYHNGSAWIAVSSLYT